MNRNLTRPGVLAATALLVAAVSAGQELANTTFDTTVAGWATSADVTVAWDPLDATASPVSGSALVENLLPGGMNGSGAYQCAENIQPGAVYDFGAQIHVPSGQTETGGAQILVQWFENALCAAQLDLDLSSWVSSGTADQWLWSTARVTAPSTAVSARVTLRVLKQEAGGALRAHFDNVFLVDSSVVFSDGFEDNTTGAWSATVGMAP